MTPPVGVVRSGVYGATVIPNSAIFRWRFNEGSGSTAIDSWNNNDGTISGSASYSTDAPEGSHAIVGDGTNGEIDVSGLPGVTDYTIRFLVELDNLNNRYTPFSAVDSSGGFSLACRIETDGTITHFHYAGSPLSSHTGGSVSAGVSTEIGIAYNDSTGDAVIYQDGSQVGPGASFGSLARNPDRVGVLYNRDIDGQHVDGLVDDVRMQDEFLSESEV